MRNQAEDFVQRVRAGRIVFKPAETLFFIAGGLNDSRLASAETVENLKGEIRMLYEAGARRFMIALLPTAIPSFSKVGNRLNPELSKIPAEIEAEVPGAVIALSHWGLFFGDVMRMPASFGIENTADRCAGREIFKEDATPCEKPDAYFYYHAGHPSTAVHKVVGEKLYREATEFYASAAREIQR
jgi:phospholipase/lecithinase/hemolysin